MRFADGAQLLEALKACRDGTAATGLSVSAPPALLLDAEREPAIHFPIWFAAGICTGLLLGWGNWGKPFPLPLQAFSLGFGMVLLSGWIWNRRRVKQWEAALGITLDRKPINKIHSMGLWLQNGVLPG